MRDWIDRETMERSVFGCHVRGVFAETLPWCNGTVFVKFPGPWKLYIEKENVPGEGLSWCIESTRDRLEMS